MARARTIPDPVSWETLADLGRNLGHLGRTHGETRVGHSWLSLHFRGGIYQLGRLQFRPTRMCLDGTPIALGERVLDVHIPDAGPLAPDACDESFRAAPAFFRRHFGHDYRFAVCTSWRLDPQLAEYLPPETNIVRFQRRFLLTEHALDADGDIVRFVFERIAASPDDLPQRTTLERAIATHLRAGRHWQAWSGWLRLRPDEWTTA